MPNNNFNNQNIQNKTNNDYNGILNKEIAIKILNSEDGRELFDYAQKVGKKIAENKISVSQIRKIFSEVKKLNNYDDWKYRLRLIRAQIGYTAGRFSKQKGMKGFRNDLFVLIDSVLDGENKQLKNFINFFEAVIAYHRDNEGKE